MSRAQLFAPGETFFNDWTVCLSFKPGALATDTTSDRDFILFRSGDINSTRAEIAIALRVNGDGGSGLPVYSVVASFTDYGTGTTELEWGPSTAIPSPDQSIHVFFQRDGAPAAGNLYLFGAVGKHPTSLNQQDTAALTTHVFSGTTQIETTLLGKSFRADTQLNAEPEGVSPVVANVKVYRTALSNAAMLASIGDRPAADAANLDFYFKGNGGGSFEESGADYTTERSYLVPNRPVVNSGDSIEFSGEGGVAHVEYTPLLEQFFDTPETDQKEQDWSFIIQATTPPETTFYDASGRTKATLAHLPGLFHLYLENIAGPAGGFRLFADVETGEGTKNLTNSTNLSGNTEYIFSINRSPDRARLRVDGDATTSTAIVGLGPELDEDTLPELFIGMYRDDTAGTSGEQFTYPFRGKVKGWAMWGSNTPLAAFASGLSSLAEIRPDAAIMFHDATRATEDRVPDLGKNNLTAALEIPASSAGDEQAPPFWTDGPIDDGEVVAAGHSLLFGQFGPLVPSTSAEPAPYIEPMLNDLLATDAVTLRFGNRVLLASNNKAYVINTDSKAMRPLGVPKPTVKLTPIPSGPGLLNGVCAYGYRWLTKDGTRGPLLRFGPTLFENEAARIGGASNGLGAEYGQTVTPADGHFSTADDYSLGVHNSVPAGNYSVEALVRLDPTLDDRDLREEIWERGLLGDDQEGTDARTWAHIGGVENGTVDTSGDFTAQFAFTLGADPANNKAETLFTIGRVNNQTGRHALSDPDTLTNDLIVSVFNDHSGSGDNELVVSYGNTRDEKWAAFLVYTMTWFNNAADKKLTTGNFYNIVLTKVGNLIEMWVYERTAAGAETWTKQTTTITLSSNFIGRPGANIGIGCCRTIDEPGIYQSVGTNIADGSNTKLKADHTLSHFRLWERGLSDLQVRETKYRFFDPLLDANMLVDLLHDIPFAIDRHYDTTKQVRDRVQNIDQWINRKDRDTRANGGHQQNRLRASCPSVWDFEYTAWAQVIRPTSPTDVSTSPFYWGWSRIGNGSLIVGSGDSLLYSEFTERLDQGNSNPLTTNRRAFNWMTANFTATDGASGTIAVNDLFLNGQRKTGVAGNAVARNIITGSNVWDCDYGTWREGGSNQYKTDVAEVRMWNTHKYTNPGDFKWITTRVPQANWSELVHYYRMLTEDVTAGTPNTIANKGTSVVSPNIMSYTSADATIIALSGRDIPAPPGQYISAFELCRTEFFPVEDPLDTEEVREAKRIVRNQPMFVLATIPVGVASYRDNIPDAGLGAIVDEGSGIAPTHVKGAFLWNQQLGLFGDPLEEHVIWFAEYGEQGIESYPVWMKYHVTAPSGSPITAATELGGLALVMGRDWAMFLEGSPSATRPVSLGGGIGADNARCLTTHAGRAYSFNGTLWELVPGQEPVDFGRPIRDLLPSVDNCRLAVSATLASLLVIDESTGDSLRYHFPSKEWTRETREIRGTTDVDGKAWFAHTSGFASYRDKTTYGDEVYAAQDVDDAAETTTTSQNIKLSGLTTNIQQPDDTTRYWDYKGQRVLVVDGSNRGTGVVDYSDANGIILESPLSFTPNEGALVYFGVDDNYTFLDTGPDNLTDGGAEAVRLKDVDLSAISGTWEVSHESKDDPGDPTDISGLDTYQSSFPTTVGTRARFHRVVARACAPAGNRVGYISAEISPLQGDRTGGVDA